MIQRLRTMVPIPFRPKSQPCNHTCPLLALVSCVAPLFTLPAHSNLPNAHTIVRCRGHLGEGRRGNGIEFSWNASNQRPPVIPPPRHEDRLVVRPPAMLLVDGGTFRRAFRLPRQRVRSPPLQCEENGWPLSVYGPARMLYCDTGVLLRPRAYFFNWDVHPSPEKKTTVAPTVPPSAGDRRSVGVRHRRRAPRAAASTGPRTGVAVSGGSRI